MSIPNPDEVERRVQQNVSPALCEMVKLAVKYFIDFNAEIANARTVTELIRELDVARVFIMNQQVRIADAQVARNMAHQAESIQVMIAQLRYIDK